MSPKDPGSPCQMMSKGRIITSSARHLGSMKPFSVSVLGPLTVGIDSGNPGVVISLFAP